MPIEDELSPDRPSSNSDGPVEILYEIQRHASGGLPSASSCDRSLQVSGGVKRGSLSHVFAKGVHLLKEKWSRNKRTRALNDGKSLFISSNGEHLAVASGNKITILQEEDAYMSPCGLFENDDVSTIYMYGAWIEPQGILGVVDDMGTLYIVKSDGEEISRTTSRQMKLLFPVVGVIALQDLTSERSLLLSFCIVTTDGGFHCIDSNGKTISCATSSFNLNNQLKMNGPTPLRMACLDFYPAESLVAMVCNAASESGNVVNDSGFYSICLWRFSTNLQLEPLFFSPAFEGLFFPPGGKLEPFVAPKVLLSPHGNYVAALDLNGSLYVYAICRQPFILSLISFNAENPGEGKRKCLRNVVNFSWWSDLVVILSTCNGSLAMFDMKTGQKIPAKDQVVHSPVLSRIPIRERHVFALQNLPSTESEGSLLQRESADITELTNGAHENDLHPNTYQSWNLISMSERSVAEIYEMLIQNKQYQEALDFARSHHLDSDEVYKSQWLCSDQGVEDINTVLRNVGDHEFVLLECVEKVGKTEDAALALLLHGFSRTDCFKFSSFENDKNSAVWKYWTYRLQLLQCMDRLETFLGINMGRFSMKEYSKFRSLPISESAISLAERGKIGSLNLLFKRHPYSLSRETLRILGAIPETIPVQTYGQLLPGRCPPPSITSRDEDWVESEQMIAFVNDNLCEWTIDIRTENVLKLSSGFVWPSVSELSEWYKNRAIEIDSLSGQLDNCLCLLDLAFHKGVVELTHFLEDVTYLNHLAYSNYEGANSMLSIISWVQLPDYEKFKMMLKGVEEEMLLGRLLEKAVPFMHVRDCSRTFHVNSTTDVQLSTDHQNAESFLVTWLKEIAAENKLDVCLTIIKEGCEGLLVNGIFKDGVEAVESALTCIYSCTQVNCWNIMASIISVLPRRIKKDKSSMDLEDLCPGNAIGGFASPRPFGKSGTLDASATTGTGIVKESTILESIMGDDHERKACICEELDTRVKTTEGHIEVGRLLAFYQVPKPMSFFLVAHLDEKNVKQLIRLLLSKFSRQKGRADADWANLWNDMQCFQAKAFSFLDKEHMLTEFCRGLLKAGKFSLARNYLKRSDKPVMAFEKAESLVIQAAREYFFSGSSLSGSEIWKAKECLHLFPDSVNVKAELDMIDALTKKLPNLGVTLLPMQFRQIGNPMEIITMVITNQTRSYLDVDELIEIAKLLGLKSQDDIAAIQEAVAREAADTGDLQLAFELCINLAEKGHGPVWDLASAMARAPILENIDTASRKKLLGFALSYCDDESVGELLNAWKDINIQRQNEKLMVLTGSPRLDSFSRIMQLQAQVIHDSGHLDASGGGILYDSSDDNKHENLKNVEDILHKVAKGGPTESRTKWDGILKESRNASFVFGRLPWLFKLFVEEEYRKQTTSSAADCLFVRVQAGLCILSWLAANNLVPNDNLILSLAKHVIEIPANGGEDVSGCSILLNLVDSLGGVKWIEEQLRDRGDYQVVHTMMNLGMIYSSLQNSALGCSSPSQRRKLLSLTFQERNWSFSTDVCTDEVLKTDGIESQFWREWSSKLEEQKMLAEQARELQGIFPGVDAARFLSGDLNFIEDVILSFVDSVKLEKKHILKKAAKLADTYGLKRSKVLVHYLRCTLVSRLWTDDEILSEVSDFKDDIVASAAEIVSMIGSTVYPEISGLNKQRISYIYNILSACCSFLRTQGSNFVHLLEPSCEHSLELFQFYKILEQECKKISFIEDLNFKNIADLLDLSFKNFNEEIYSHVSEGTVDALAEMVRVLVSIYDDPKEKGLISRTDVFRRYIVNILADLNAGYKARFYPMLSGSFFNFLSGVQGRYENCKVYFRALPEEEMLNLLGKLCILCIPDVSVDIPNEPLGKDCLLELLNFWITIAEDIHVTTGGQFSEGVTLTSTPLKYFTAFRDSIMDDRVSAMQGWSVLSRHSKFSNCLRLDISLFCKAMVLSGCDFKVILNIFSEGKSTTTMNPPDTQDITQLYTNTTNVCLSEVMDGSCNQHDLHKLLSSLSKFVDDSAEDLSAVRHVIWEKMTAFSENMQLSSNFRVYLLELMQSIAGKQTEKFSDVFAWEGWDDPVIRCGTRENIDAPCRLTSNLVALKTNQLVSTISQDLKVSSEDLGTINSAISCYLSMLEAAISKGDIDIMRAILVEWEKLFVSQMDSQKSSEPDEEQFNWSGDEWGEGWEEESAKEVKHEFPLVHPLHACWMVTIRKIIETSQTELLAEVMDQSTVKSQLVLLSKDEAEELLGLLKGINSILSLKIVLLLPYEDLWFQSLDSLEDELKQGGLQSKSSEESQLLMLILSSGLLPSIANDSSYSKIFSYLCYVMGHLSRRSQEELLKQSQTRSSKSSTSSILFCRLLLPCFVAELIISGQYLLAGHIVSQWMHAHSSFRLVNILEVGLRKYLEGLLQSRESDTYKEEGLLLCSSLACTCTNLNRKLGSLLQTSLSALKSIS